MWWCCFPPHLAIAIAKINDRTIRSITLTHNTMLAASLYTQPQQRSMTRLQVQHKLTEQWPAPLTRELCCALRDQRCQHRHNHREGSHLAPHFSYRREESIQLHSSESIRTNLLKARARQPQICTAILATRLEHKVMENYRGRNEPLRHH